MAKYIITCYSCTKPFTFNGDEYKKEGTVRLHDKPVTNSETKKQRIIQFCSNCGKPNTINVNPHANKGEEKPINGEEASQGDVDTVNKGQNLIMNAPDRLDSIASTLITLNTVFLGVYTGALTFLKIPENISSWPYSMIILAIPLISSLFSLLICGIEYFPQWIDFLPNTPKEIKDNVKKVTNSKYFWVALGSILFFAAILIASLIIFFGGIYKAPSSPANSSIVQFIVSQDEVLFFKNLNLTVSDDSLRTSNLTLIDSQNGTYKIQVPGDNRNITLNQSLVKGIIYF